MMDTVWIRLTVDTTSAPSSEFGFSEKLYESFMFGPHGVTRFACRGGNGAVLYDVAGKIVANVNEDFSYIMTVLSKMRGTEGKLDAKQSKKTARKSKASKAKKTRKVSANNKPAP